MNYQTFSASSKENMQEITQYEACLTWCLRQAPFKQFAYFNNELNIQIYIRYSNIVLPYSSIHHKISKPIVSYQDFISGL